MLCGGLAMQKTIIEREYYSNYGVPKAAYNSLIGIGDPDKPFWDVELSLIIPLTKYEQRFSYHKEYGILVPQTVAFTLYDECGRTTISRIYVDRAYKRMRWEKPTVRQYIAPFKIQLTIVQNPASNGMYMEEFNKGIHYSRFLGECNPCNVK